MSTDAVGKPRSLEPSRVALVTGGTGGIGRAVALALAASGDRVLFVGRDHARGAEVLARLRQLGPGLGHAFLPADLSLLGDTARVTEKALHGTDRFDAVVFCAGLLSLVPEWTEEGFERNFVLNYLSRYLMTRRLLPLLEASPGGRLVLVANAGRYPDTLDFSDLQYRRGKPGLRVAGRTQFANDLLATELAHRLRGSRVEVACVYPGLVRTDVFRNARGLPRAARLLVPLIHRFLARPPEEAARTPAFLARDPGATGTNGRFFGPGLREIAVPARALRPDRRLALWETSEQLVRPYLPEAADPACRPPAAVG